MSSSINIGLWNTHSKFIITPNRDLITIDGPEANSFILEYTTQISEKYNGKIFDSYGIDRQGASLKIESASRSLLCWNFI